jgi:anti-sigma regulatory factor (Ser/Thr protein kinase)
MDLEIALGELLQNIVRHESCPAGKATFSIEMSFLGLDLQVQVIDSCEPLADLSFLTKSHQPTENGGMGISLINKIASTYTINAIGKGNIHKLVVNDFLTSS